MNKPLFLLNKDHVYLLPCGKVYINNPKMQTRAKHLINRLTKSVGVKITGNYVYSVQPALVLPSDYVHTLRDNSPLAGYVSIGRYNQRPLKWAILNDNVLFLRSPLIFQSDILLEVNAILDRLYEDAFNLIEKEELASGTFHRLVLSKEMNGVISIDNIHFR